jgi:dipeptide/tripeptide permease
MQSLLSTVLVFFMTSLPALAAVKELDAASKPAETVDMVWVVIFGIAFVGMIVGFLIYLFMRKEEEVEQK